jgi:hypothetical protein
MVVISDDRPTEAVFIAGQTTGSCTGRDVIHIRLTFPRESDENNTTSGIGRVVKRGMLDCTTAAAIEKLWEQMLCDVRYDEREKVEARAKMHADVYHFSFGSKSGVTDETDRNTLVGQLGRLGLQLAAFADASTSVQSTIAAGLSANATRLSTFVGARNSRRGAPPICKE